MLCLSNSSPYVLYYIYKKHILYYIETLIFAAVHRVVLKTKVMYMLYPIYIFTDQSE